MIEEKQDVSSVFRSLDDATSAFMQLLASFSETEINTIPFRGSWTAAQVAEHVTKSNIGITRSLNVQGTPARRAADERVKTLQVQFLNFLSKLQSPAFILPAKDIYEKKRVIDDLQLSIERLSQTSRNVDLSEEISHFIFGDITKLELLYFVLFHTKRHTHQLNNIFRSISTSQKNVANRKIISFMHVSLDGFVAGTNGEMNWIMMDDEIFEDAIDLASTTDAALYGRTTYQMMESYWPSVLASAEATKNELKHAEWVENVKKIVFSTSLENAGWTNTRLIRENIAEEVLKLKQQHGRNMMIFGSPRLTHSFMEMGLIDEYRINLNPVLLGKGVPLFMNIGDRTNLTLIKSRNFESGVVGLHYETRRMAC